MWNDAVLRRATSEDVGRLTRLYVRSQHLNSNAAARAVIARESVQRWLRNAVLRDDVWLLEREYGQFAGLLAISGDELDVLDVDPELRLRGYGTQLMAHAKTRRPGGLRARVGDGRHEARSFLLRHGFRSMRRPVPDLEELNWGPGAGR